MNQQMQKWGRLAKGVPKHFTEEEIKLRTERLAAARAKRQKRSMKLITPDKIEYRTHEAVVAFGDRIFTVPIKCDASRAEQNQQIEDWFKAANSTPLGS